MSCKYKIAHLIGLTRKHEEQFRNVEKILTAKGYIVFAPVFYTLEEYESFGEYPNMIDDMCYEKLLLADLMVLVTPEHIGQSTSIRIQQAHELGKEVYILADNNLVKFNYISECGSVW